MFHIYKPKVMKNFHNWLIPGHVHGFVSSAVFLAELLGNLINVVIFPGSP